MAHKAATSINRMSIDPSRPSTQRMSVQAVHTKEEEREPCNRVETSNRYCTHCRMSNHYTAFCSKLKRVSEWPHAGQGGSEVSSGVRNIGNMGVAVCYDPGQMTSHPLIMSKRFFVYIMGNLETLTPPINNKKVTGAGGTELIPLGFLM